jgi:hypothetical protein
MSRGTRESDFRATRGETGCVGVIVVGAILVWQALLVADASGIRPALRDDHYDANVMLRWTLPIAVLLWLASFVPRLPTRARLALVRGSLTLLVGTGIAWFVWTGIFSPGHA